jgi:hypothetical protein
LHFAYRFTDTFPSIEQASAAAEQRIDRGDIRCEAEVMFQDPFRQRKRSKAAFVLSGMLVA